MTTDLPRACVIVPARLGSTRFPRKVLASDTGRALIVHVLEQAARARCAGRVCAATDSDEVASVVAAAGFEVVATSPKHPNGTSRLAEAADCLGLGDDAVVVNVQGDEPEIDPGLIDRTAMALVAGGAEMATLVSPIANPADHGNPNVVKAVLRERSRCTTSLGEIDLAEAVYFSRAALPFHRDIDTPAPERFKHAGLYAYRAGFLRRYVTLPESPLEIAEALEQLRAIEHGVRIAVAVSAFDHAGIDTLEQYHAFVARWASRG